MQKKKKMNGVIFLFFKFVVFVNFDMFSTVHAWKNGYEKIEVWINF